MTRYIHILHDNDGKMCTKDELMNVHNGFKCICRQTNKRNEMKILLPRRYTIKIAYINKIYVYMRSDFLKANVSFDNWQKYFCMVTNALVFSLQL